MHSILLGGSDYEIGDGLEYPYREYRRNALTKTAAPDSRLPRPSSVRQRGPALGGIFWRNPILRFGLNSLLWWLVVALAFVLLLAASLFGFFLHLSEFLLLFGRKDSLNLRPRSLVDLLHLFSLLILSQ